jgi:hypothetical protein
VVTGICCHAVYCSFLYGRRSWAAYVCEPSLVIVGVTSSVCAMLKLFVVSVLSVGQWPLGCEQQWTWFTLKNFI